MVNKKSGTTGKEGKMETEGKRVKKHMEIISRMELLENSVQELWELIYKVNPSLSSPKTAEDKLEPVKVTLSDFLTFTPERISTITGSIREAVETLDNELH